MTSVDFVSVNDLERRIVDRSLGSLATGQERSFSKDRFRGTGSNGRLDNQDGPSTSGWRSGCGPA